MPGRERAVRQLRRAVRGRRLTRTQAATLDALISIVANESADLLVMAGRTGGRDRSGGGR